MRYESKEKKPYRQPGTVKNWIYRRVLIQKMADTLGVSFTAFHTRLSELDLFERRPVEEYLHEGLRYGGELHAGSN